MESYRKASPGYRDSPFLAGGVDLESVTGSALTTDFTPVAPATRRWQDDVNLGVSDRVPVFLACFHLHFTCSNSIFELNPSGHTEQSWFTTAARSFHRLFPSANISWGKSYLFSIFSFLSAVTSDCLRRCPPLPSAFLPVGSSCGTISFHASCQRPWGQRGRISSIK